MSSIFKKFEPNSVSITPFLVSKSLTAVSGSPSEITLYRGEHYGGPKEIASTWPTSSNGEYNYLVYDSIRHLYYHLYEKTKEHVSNNYKYLRLYDKFVLFGINQNSYGEKIQAGTVNIHIYDGATEHHIVDDKNGNLIDTTISSSYTSLLSDIQDHSVGKWNFADACEFQKGTGNNYITGEYLRDHSNSGNNMYLHGVLIQTGSYGQMGRFITGSYAEVENNEVFNFRTNEDFSILCSLKIPPVSDHTGTEYESIFSKNNFLDVSTEAYSNIGYPYDISLLKDANYGKLQFSRFDGKNKTTLVSSLAINDDRVHQVLFQKSGSVCECWIDGIARGNTPDLCIFDVHNDLNVRVGLNGAGLHPFHGSVGEIEIKQQALSSTVSADVKLGIDYYIGNVFYADGMAVITSRLPMYQTFYTSNDVEWNFSAFGTNYLYEYEYICTVDPGDFLHTWNPSTMKPSRSIVKEYKDFVTSSLFTPYVTKIGLYDDNYTLLAVARLSRPIPRLKNMNTSYIIRFDA